MSEESVAKKVLAIAKEREEKRLKDTEDKICGFIEKRFDKCLKEAKNWKVDIVDVTKLKVSIADFITASERLGLSIHQEDEGVKFKISIPKYKEGTEKTPVQIMLEDFKDKLDAVIKEEKKEAERICTEILEKLNNEDFISERKNDDLWKIKVEDVPFPATMSRYFLEKVKRIMRDNGFAEVKILHNSSCELLITDNE